MQRKSNTNEAAAAAPETSNPEGVAAEPAELINKSVIKATVLLNELGRHPRGITVTELAQLVKMSRPTTFRLLLSLEQTGFVERNDNKYQLGWKIARLGRLADPHGGIITRIQPVLRALVDEFNELTAYAVYNGDGEFDLIAEVQSSRLMTTKGYIGMDLPVHATATGKMALSELSDDKVIALLPKSLPKYTRKTITNRTELIRDLQEVRRRGFSIVDDELEESLFSLAIAVRDNRNNMIGILSISGPSERMKQQQPEDIAERLIHSAHEIVKILTERSSNTAS